MSGGTVNGLLMYGIIPAGRGRLEQLTGLRDAPVKAVRAKALSALVSEIPSQRIRPERRNIAAFEAVLRDVLDQGVTLLPMAFGVVAENEDEVKAFLETHEETLLRQLEHVDGKVEMGLYVTWTPANIFEYFVEKDPQLRDTRDRLFGGQQEPTRDEKIELGRLFEQLRDAQRQADTDKIVQALEKRWEVKAAAAKGDAEVTNLACLIPREAQGEFEKAVRLIAKDFDDNYSLRIDGPWPPHSFCNVRLSPPVGAK